MKKILNLLLAALLCVNGVSAQDLNVVFDASPKPAKNPVYAVQYIAEPVAGLSLGLTIAYKAMSIIDADVMHMNPLGRRIAPVGAAYGAAAGLAGALAQGLFFHEKTGATGVILMSSAAGALAFPLTKLASTKFKVLGGGSSGTFTIAAALGAAVGAGSTEIIRLINGQ